MNLALIGYGKMGRTVESLIKAGDTVVLKIDADNQEDFAHLKEADVAIEFTTPETAVINLVRCFEAGIPVVCGTTGWYDHLDALKARCENQQGALFYASNFSIGVNLFFKLNRELATLMNTQPQYDVLLEETHHIHKKDAPSGTAISLANDILKEVKRKKQWVKAASDKEDELVVLSRREGEVPGTHQVRWFSPGDEISIEHKAHSRQGFAEGALAAARWIIGKKGVFTMADMLKSL